METKRKYVLVLFLVENGYNATFNLTDGSRHTSVIIFNVNEKEVSLEKKIPCEEPLEEGVWGKESDQEDVTELITIPLEKIKDIVIDFSTNTSVHTK